MGPVEQLRASRTCTTCPYCGVGCGVDATSVQKGNHSPSVNVTGDPDHPANLGRLCVKGSALGDTLGEEGRLLKPRLRGEECDWETAMQTMADGFSRTIAEHGPDSVAFYLSGQLLTEDYYVANKLMKGFIGSANVDTNSRLCMSSAVAAYKRAFGADAVPCCYEDLDQAELIVLVGSNAAWTHPILFQRMQAAGAKLVVIDPRATATAATADLHLPISPGSDAVLFNGLLRYLWRNNQLDQGFIETHCDGFEEALAAAADCDLPTVAHACGVSEEQLSRFYQWFVEHQQTITFYSQGVNQSSSGTDKNNAILNCHLASGRVGKPGSGPFSITGQPNAMGGREVGGLANMLAAHMDFTPGSIDRVGRFWQTQQVAKRPGLKAVDLFDAVERGEIKAIWIMATNPAVSMPDAGRVARALRQCPLVVVSDCVSDTDTARCADLLLPATTWGEKNGTVTNSERRISRQRSFLSPPGEARHDWQIICDLATRMGFGAHFDFAHPSEIFREHATLSGFENQGQRAFDISGLSNIDRQQYDNLVPVQWPVNAHYPDGSQRLFEDGKFYTPSQRANFIAIHPRLPQHQISDEHPLWLNSGRMRDQWHTMTRTGRARNLLDHSEMPEIQVNPADATPLAISDGQLVELRSPRGRMRGRAVLTSAQKPGELFAPIHWSETLSQFGRVSALAEPVFDPVSGQPELKQVAVSLRPIPVASYATLICRPASAARLQEWLERSEEVQENGIAHWYRVPCDGGFRYELALTDATDLRALAGMTKLLVDTEAVRWQQLHMQFSERWLAHTESHAELLAFRTNDWRTLPDRRALERWLDEPLPEQPAQLLVNIQSGTPIVCSCLQVSRQQIDDAIEGGCHSVEALGEQLGCGTNCGSCKPEISALLARSGVAIAV